jgi:hypothetical protein
MELVQLPADAHLVGHGREAAEAHELGHVDADSARAGQRQKCERWNIPVVVEHPAVADVAVHEWAQQHQRPPLHNSPSTQHRKLDCIIEIPPPTPRPANLGKDSS